MIIDKKIAEKILDEMGNEAWLEITTGNNNTWNIWPGEPKEIYYKKLEITDNVYQDYVYINKTLGGYIDISHSNIEFYNKFIKEFTAHFKDLAGSYSKNYNNISWDKGDVGLQNKLKELWV